MPLLANVVVILLRSIVILTPNRQFLDCATIAFSERYVCQNLTYLGMLSTTSPTCHLDTLYTTSIIPYPTALPYGNGMVLHFYQQQESSTTKIVHKVINKGLKAYV